MAAYFSSSRTLSIFSGVRYSWNTWSTIIIGAPVQAARHSSSCLRKMRPSGVLSPSLMPSFFSTMRHHVFGAVQHAGDVRAHADVMPAARMQSRTSNRTWRLRRPGSAAASGIRRRRPSAPRSGSHCSVPAPQRSADEHRRALPSRRETSPTQWSISWRVCSFSSAPCRRPGSNVPRSAVCHDVLIGRPPRTRCPACR